MSDVPRSTSETGTDLNTGRGPRIVIRYEEDGNKLVAVCEDSSGERWYEIVLVDGEVLF